MYEGIVKVCLKGIFSTRAKFSTSQFPPQVKHEYENKSEPAYSVAHCSVIGLRNHLYFSNRR